MSEITMRKTIGSTWLAPVANGKPLSTTQRCGRLRKAGAEIVAVLKERASGLTYRQFTHALPHVPSGTLRRRLTEMSSAGNLERAGHPHSYLYGLSATAMST